MELLSLYLIINTKIKEGHDSWIHGLCLGWEIIALIVLFINNASIGHYPKVLAWPLFFESAYLIVKWDSRMIKSIRNAIKKLLDIRYLNTLNDFVSSLRNRYGTRFNKKSIIINKVRN